MGIYGKVLTFFEMCAILSSYARLFTKFKEVNLYGKES